MFAVIVKRRTAERKIKNKKSAYYCEITVVNEGDKDEQHLYFCFLSRLKAFKIIVRQ